MSLGFLRLKINHLMLLGEQNSLLLTVPPPSPKPSYTHLILKTKMLTVQPGGTCLYPPNG